MSYLKSCTASSETPNDVVSVISFTWFFFPWSTASPRNEEKTIYTVRSSVDCSAPQSCFEINMPACPSRERKKIGHDVQRTSSPSLRRSKSATVLNDKRRTDAEHVSKHTRRLSTGMWASYFRKHDGELCSQTRKHAVTSFLSYFVSFDL